MSAGTTMSASVRHSLRWSTADIAVGAALGVGCGVVQWGFNFVSQSLFAVMAAILPGLSSLFHAIWYFSGTLGVTVIRKPGAAIYVNVVGVAVQMLLGNQFSFGFVFVSAALQGIVAELPFVVTRYRLFNLPMTMLAGALVAVEYGFYLLFFRYQAVSLFSPRGIIHMTCEVIGGVAIAGVFSWFLFRAIAATGALDRFASGQSVRGTVD
ncbi:Hydroxymethylpyrimidine transport system permease protein [Bifidobacterium sp. DSM 109958]|uniref:Hydroxymethylpyrimidine transport system permease protein n=1 Tax=Bifidobacterium moraviense TaxID=2675323 RepID=A0A7Y0F367_9BIFI|nr:ECF transporter S component [Bifidobacterium sp. DSM 109958]NMN01184.1 Hydroxymethylpyrimidine transport system permease protein [Bifidobacterium sp. DSM 109958]